jgi:hypothetical protein
MQSMNLHVSCKSFKPLETVVVHTDSTGYVLVTDSAGRSYLNTRAAEQVNFVAAGSLGTHTIYHTSDTGDVLEKLNFQVDCETSIEGSAFYRRLLNILYFTMGYGGEKDNILYKNKVYNFFVRWIRDHTHVLKGMKYFEDDLKSAIELYRDSQRDDGMIWDNVYHRDRDLTYFTQVFRNGSFVMPTEDRKYEFRRIPAEADVEYLYVEGIYNTWRATGDDDWMASMLDSAVKAMEYDLSSPYRWSQKYQLIKRGFTIDTWDFQSWIDVKNSGHIMTIDLNKTQFGVMHGDNTGFAQSCRFLARMLRQAGRGEEAVRFEQLAEDFISRLNEVSWNGRFFTHHVPENKEVDRSGLGGSLEEQLSLSNAYALNRGTSHEQCRAIIKEYQRIKENLPEGSVGEWYTIYPPFEQFNDGHSDKWEYMNGGIITIVAGELAKGAFEHGFEEYGIDILQRIGAIAEKHDGYLHCAYKGQLLPRPETEFRTLDLSAFSNIDFYSDLQVTDAPELGKGEAADLDEKPVGKVEYEGVPFLIPDPARNGGKGCICLSNTDQRHYANATIPVNAKAQSLYVMQVMSGASPCGLITLEYEDGSKAFRYMNEYKEIVRWYQPEREMMYGNRKSPMMRVVWQGKNNVCDRVGIGTFAFDNPNPEKEIKNILLSRMENGSVWYVMGITLSNQKAYFPPSDVSFGIPDSWGAAAVVYSLLEGLAGVSDQSSAFEDVTLSPRWSYTDENQVGVTVKYPASRGYVTYHYRHDRENSLIRLHATGSGNKIKCHCLLPKGCVKVRSVEINGRDTVYTLSRVEDSSYADFELSGSVCYEIEMKY